jgi:cyclophilin family peptidyl-prolyl cis-trans isomerase
MARTNAPNSATSQFFLNFVDNTATGKTSTGDPANNLDPGGVSPDGYAVFGKIIKGLDVLDKMAKVQTTTIGQFENVPAQPITIISITRQ